MSDAMIPRHDANSDARALVASLHERLDEMVDELTRDLTEDERRVISAVRAELDQHFAQFRDNLSDGIHSLPPMEPE